MNKILRNIRDCVIAQRKNKKIPNLFSCNFDSSIYGDSVSGSFHFNKKNKSDLLHLYVHMDKEVIKFRPFCWREMKWKPKSNIYKMRLTLSGLKNTDKKYEFTSKEKPIVKEIYNLINDYISYTQKKELNNIYKITKSDVDLINNNDITHNF